MKVISIKKEKILIVLYLFIIIMGIFVTYKREAVTTFSMPMSKKIILIDPGHGGWDPGMVGDENILEKDLNLEIAKKLQEYLEQGGAYVINTRTEDEALGNKKNSDMMARKGLINSSSADLLISIHQNSYPQEAIQGAQVFYYNESSKSKLLAESIQKQLKTFLQPNNKRLAKPNTNYYILKQTDIPAVIVECGFLSNPQEKKSLTAEEYQSKVAWAIYVGIIDYYTNLTNSN